MDEKERGETRVLLITNEPNRAYVISIFAFMSA